MDFAEHVYSFTEVFSRQTTQAIVSNQEIGILAEPHVRALLNTLNDKKFKVVKGTKEQDRHQDIDAVKKYRMPSNHTQEGKILKTYSIKAFPDCHKREWKLPMKTQRRKPGSDTWEKAWYHKGKAEVYIFVKGREVLFIDRRLLKERAIEEFNKFKAKQIELTPEGQEPDLSEWISTNDSKDDGKHGNHYGGFKYVKLPMELVWECRLTDKIFKLPPRYLKETYGDSKANVVAWSDWLSTDEREVAIEEWIEENNPFK